MNKETGFIDAAPHLRWVLHREKRQKIAIVVVQFFQDNPSISFNTIACSGLSGLLIAPMIADLTHTDLLVVRKDDEGCRSNKQVEGVRKANIKYIIVDDLIDSGKTIKRIIQQIDIHRNKAELVGVYLYYRIKDRDGLEEQQTDYQERIGHNVPFWCMG